MALPRTMTLTLPDRRGADGSPARVVVPRPVPSPTQVRRLRAIRAWEARSATLDRVIGPAAVRSEH